jgi:glycosyltransferase involved in cell wall biosynthesis
MILTDLPVSPDGKVGWPWTEDSVQLQKKEVEISPWPRISIVTPSYNQAPFLEETIRSILLQRYPNLEYILIDGGSCDGSIDIIRKYEHQLSYWVSEPDRGQSHAINKGFERATGDIITFCNSDDIYLPGTFFDVASRWVKHQESGLVVGSFLFMDADSKITGSPRLPILPHQGPIDLTLGPPGIYRLHQVSTFYSRKALDSVGRQVQEEYKYVMDRELLYRVLRGYPAILVERPYGVFRKHEESKSVADIIPFSREFAELYLHNLSGEKNQDGLRRRMAQYRRSNGYLKYARVTGNRFAALKSLVQALFYMPSLLVQPRYWASFRFQKSKEKSL